MKYLKILASVALCAVIMLVIRNADANAVTKYEMVRQGSVGETVQRVQIRLRELDYLHFKPTGSFKGMTVSATIAFQQTQETEDGGWVAADGEAGEQTQSILFSARARRAAIPSDVVLPSGAGLSGTPAVQGDIMSWSEIKSKLNNGSSYKLFDYNTGKSFRIKYLGGEGHAEVECSTVEDTAAFLEVFGGEFNYSKRSMVFQLNDDTFIAASMIGSPHGSDAVPGNDMDGHTCLFFDGSLSHVGMITDVEHQKQIYIAAGM